MAGDDGDGGVHESVAANMRAAVVIAMQVGERAAKTWAALARDSQQRATADSRLLAARVESERAAVVASLAVVDRPEWWAAADQQQVADVLETAATWRDQDPVAARAIDTIGREVQDRYGVSVEALQQRVRAGQDHAEAAEALTVADVLDRAAEEHESRAERVNDRSAGGPSEAAATRQLEQEAAAGTAAAADTTRDAGELAYDSAERRAAFAAELEQATGSDPGLIAGRIRSDVNFAHPAEHATSVRGTSSVTRGRPGMAPDRSRHRPSRTR